MATTYVVEPGDTLGKIAKAHHTTAEAIRAANAGLIADVNKIVTGWKLTIPGEGEPVPERVIVTEEARATDSGETYTIRAGDNLSALANEWRTTVEAICALNAIADANFIFAGQVVKKPSGSTATTTPGNTTTPVVNLSGASGLVFTRSPLDPGYVVTGQYLEMYEGNQLHVGLDLGGIDVGTPIFAPAGGKATVHRPEDGTGFDTFGICVVLDHPNTPFWSIYAHMDDTPLASGSSVSPGDTIGFVGWTGKVLPKSPAGRHLHWQVSDSAWFPKKQEATRDPAAFFAPGVGLPQGGLTGAGPGSFGQCAKSLGGPRPRKGGPSKPKRKLY